jgi:exosortase
VTGSGGIGLTSPTDGGAVRTTVLQVGAPTWMKRSTFGLIVTLGFVVVLSALYSTVVPDLVAQWWDDPNYSHGFLVPVFAGVLVWRRRGDLSSLEPNGTWLGLPVLVAGVAMLLLGDLGAELFLMRSSLVVVLTGLVLFHLGPRILRVLAFPLAFLMFMVPLPATILYAVTLPLQTLAARNATWILDVLGVPVLLDGNVIHLSQISLGVTEACSGIRSLISLLALAVGWAYLTLPAGWQIAALGAAAVPVSVIANAGRVVGTAFVGEWIGTDYARGFVHIFSGWLVFVVAVGCLLAVHRLLAWTATMRAERTH